MGALSTKVDKHGVELSNVVSTLSSTSSDVKKILGLMTAPRGPGVPGGTALDPGSEPPKAEGGEEDDKEETPGTDPTATAICKKEVDVENHKLIIGAISIAPTNKKLEGLDDMLPIPFTQYWEKIGALKSTPQWATVLERIGYNGQSHGPVVNKKQAGQIVFMKLDSNWHINARDLQVDIFTN